MLESSGEFEAQSEALRSIKTIGETTLGNKEPVNVLRINRPLNILSLSHSLERTVHIIHIRFAATGSKLLMMNFLSIQPCEKHRNQALRRFSGYEYPKANEFKT